MKRSLIQSAKITIFISTIFFSIGIFAAPCTNLSLNMGGTVVLDSPNNSPAVTFTVTRPSSSNGTCNYYVVVENGGASNYNDRYLERSGFGNNRIDVQIYRDSGRNSPLRNASSVNGSSSNVILGTLSNSDSQTLTYYPQVIPANITERAGLYQNNFQFRLYSYNGSVSNEDFEDDRWVNLRYTHPVIADLSIVDTGGSFNIGDTDQTMNFGALATNAQMFCDVMIKYNDGYTLEMRSTYGSVLKRNPTSNSISYQMRVNNNDVSLPANSWRNVSQNFFFDSISPSGGLRIPIRVRITGTVNGATPSGSYSDTVSVRISSND